MRLLYRINVQLLLQRDRLLWSDYWERRSSIVEIELYAWLSECWNRNFSQDGRIPHRRLHCFYRVLQSNWGLCLQFRTVLPLEMQLITMAQKIRWGDYGAGSNICTYSVPSSHYGCPGKCNGCVFIRWMERGEWVRS